jgi:pyruvate kinase
MSEICLAAERQRVTQISNYRLECQSQKPDEAIAMAAMYIANHIDATAIVVFADTDSAPLWMSRICSSLPIYGLSQNRYVRGRMTLYRGVYPIDFDATQYPKAQVIQEALAKLMRLNLIGRGERILVMIGETMDNSGDTNTLKIMTV